MCIFEKTVLNAGIITVYRVIETAFSAWEFIKC